MHIILLTIRAPIVMQLTAIPQQRICFHSLIENLVKQFNTHRAAINFDSAFVNAFVPKFERGVFVMNRNEAAARTEE